MDLLPAYTHINGIISRKIFEVNQNRPWVDDSNYWQWQDDADMIIEVLRELEHEILMTREIFPKPRNFEILEQSYIDERRFSLKDIETWEIIENVDFLTWWDIDMYRKLLLIVNLNWIIITAVNMVHFANTPLLAFIALAFFTTWFILLWK